jgi:hypothetical protein
LPGGELRHDRVGDLMPTPMRHVNAVERTHR